MDNPGVKKKIIAASKTKNCAELAGWVDSIGNHLYYSARTGTSTDNVRDMALSILEHVCNKHTNLSTPTYRQCAHGPLDDRDTAWLIESNYATYFKN